MRRRGKGNVWGRNYVHVMFWWGHLEERDKLEDLGLIKPAANNNNNNNNNKLQLGCHPVAVVILHINKT